jgi:hypothetical protein
MAWVARLLHRLGLVLVVDIEWLEIDPTPDGQGNLWRTFGEKPTRRRVRIVRAT